MALAVFSVLLDHIEQMTDLPEAYSIPVAVGATEFPLHLDSGGGLSWVLSNHFPKGVYPANKVVYDYTPPPDCAPIDGTLIYGDGLRVDGFVTSDTISVGMADGDDFALLAVNAATSVDPFCFYTPIAGNFGLDLSGDSWVMQAYETGLINPIFSVDLRSSGDSRIFLSQEQNQLSDAIAWFPVKDNSDATEDGEPTESWIFTSGNTDYLMDTGASILALSKEIVSEYFRKANYPNLEGAVENGLTMWKVDCSQTMLDLTVTLSSIKSGVVKRIDVNIPGKDLKGPPLRGNTNRCKSRLVGHDPANGRKDLPYYLLGLPFIKQRLVYFDLEERQVGIISRPSS